MTRRTLGLLILSASIGLGADLPTGESLLDRYVEVTGGKAAYEARKSEVVHGTLDFAMAGLKGSVVRYARADGAYRATIDVPGVGPMDMGVRNGLAWQNSALLGPRILEGAEKAEAMKDATLDPEYRWRELYSKAETVGEESVDGEACYKVIMTRKGEDPETWYFAKASGHIVKISWVTTTQQGVLPVDMILGDYKNLGGIIRPTKETQRVAGQEIVLKLDSAEVNVPISDEAVQVPESVATLAAKQR